MTDINIPKFTKQDAEREIKALKNMGVEITEEILKDYAETSDRNCRNCKWHEDFTGVCFNSNAEERADFTSDEFSCKCHEYVEDLNENKICSS